MRCPGCTDTVVLAETVEMYVIGGRQVHPTLLLSEDRKGGWLVMRADYTLRALVANPKDPEPYRYSRHRCRMVLARRQGRRPKTVQLGGLK